MRVTTVVFAIGCPEGQTAATLHPAFARATARRAVGNQREVVTIRTVGFNGLQSFLARFTAYPRLQELWTRPVRNRRLLIHSVPIFEIYSAKQMKRMT